MHCQCKEKSAVQSSCKYKESSSVTINKLYNILLVNFLKLYLETQFEICFALWFFIFFFQIFKDLNFFSWFNFKRLRLQFFIFYRRNIENCLIIVSNFYSNNYCWSKKKNWIRTLNLKMSIIYCSWIFEIIFQKVWLSPNT